MKFVSKEGLPFVFLRLCFSGLVYQMLLTYYVLSFVNNSYTYITRNETGQEQLIETK